MVPASFVRIRKDATDIIFNTAHIVSLERRNVELTDRNRDEYANYPTTQNTAYTIFLVLIHRGSMEYIYPAEAIRDEMFEKLASTVGPFVLSLKMLPEAEQSISTLA